MKFQYLLITVFNLLTRKIGAILFVYSVLPNGTVEFEKFFGVKRLNYDTSVGVQFLVRTVIILIKLTIIFEDKLLHLNAEHALLRGF